MDTLLLPLSLACYFSSFMSFASLSTLFHFLRYMFLHSFFIFQAAERSSHSPQQTIMPVQESPRKPICIKASLNLSAPVIILPTALSGGLVLDLGKVSFSAVPEHNEQSTVASLVGHVQLSAAQLYTSVRLDLHACMHTCTHVCMHFHAYTHAHREGHTDHKPQACFMIYLVSCMQCE